MMSLRKKKSAEEIRRGILAKIHIAKKELNLSEEFYRELLFRLTGKKSCSEMAIQELEVVLKVLHEMGWVPVRQMAITQTQIDRDGMLQEIEALAKKVFGENWKRRLNNFCKSKFGLEHYKFCRHRELRALFGFLRKSEKGYGKSLEEREEEKRRKKEEFEDWMREVLAQPEEINEEIPF